MGIIKKINMNSGYTPTGKMSWSTKLASEFLGTIFLTWMIGILGVTFGGGVKFESIISGGAAGNISHLVIGFWVALDVLICLAIFSRWSCDLNPIVTTYRMLSKQNSLKYGLTKIGIQLLGGLVAGLCIWSTQEISHVVSGSADDATIRTVKDAQNAYIAIHGQTYAAAHPVDFTVVKEFRELQPWSAFTTGMDVHEMDSPTWTHSIAIIGEFLGGFILLWPIFTKEIKSPAVKDMVLLLVIGFGVAALLELGTVAWNPARLLGTNWIYDLLKPGTHSMAIFPAYAIGEILAPFALFYGQKLAHTINEVWEKWLSIGKVHDISQHIDEAKMNKIEKKQKTNKKH